MLRRVLTAYLALLTAAAPCLCCCTAGRLFAAAPPRREAPAVPAEPRCPHCCHDAAQMPAAEQPAAPRPSAPTPEQRCPCRDHVEKQATALAATADGAGLRAALHAAIDLTAVLPPAIDPATSADLRGSLLSREPFRSASDLLHVHHRLRC
ncbi:MAG TPA: hypothetical protein VGF55_33385 [Gemmataceae bacterium]|jgi:hypothetical protein